MKYLIQSLALGALLLGASSQLAATSIPNQPSSQDLLKQGRIDDAVSAARQQLAANPNAAELYYTICRADYVIGKFDASIRECEKAVALAPNNSEYHLWLGRSYGEKAERSSWFTALGLARKTRAQFEKAVELNAENSKARSDLAEFYLEAPSFLGGDVDKARSQADAMAKSKPSAAHWVKSRVAEKANDPGTAELELKSAIASSDNKPEAWLDLASFYRRQKRFQDMDDAIRKAVAVHTRPGNAFVDAAALFLRTGRNLVEAARLATEYIRSGEPEEDAPLLRAHYVLGQILEKQGDKSGAASEYAAALSLSKEYPDAREALNRVKR